MKSNTEQQFDRATQLAEEIFDTDINKMMSVRDYIKNTYGRAFCARQIYGGDHFSHIIHNAWEAENVDELPTLTEKCIKRASNINLLWVKENSNMKDEVALYRELGTIFQYQIIPLEIFWAMEYRVKNNAESFIAEQDIYKYMEWVCNQYLDKTQKFDNILEEYRQEQLQNKQI